MQAVTSTGCSRKDYKRLQKLQKFFLQNLPIHIRSQTEQLEGETFKPKTAKEEGINLRKRT